MPTVSVTVPHHHDPDEIVRRTQAHIEKLVEDFEGQDLNIEWQGRQADFSFTSLMFAIKGNVAVDEKAITVSVDLPFAAMLFKDKVEKAIRKNLEKSVADEPPE